MYANMKLKPPERRPFEEMPVKTKAIAVQKPLAQRRTRRADFERRTPIGTLGVVDLRSCIGRDGIAYSYGLLLDGKPAAIVRDEGNGSMLWLDWRDTATEKLVSDYAKTLPPLVQDGYSMPYCVDLMLAELADAADAAGAGL
ncbi:MAG: hypothetical protein IT452_10965 [Planctomycetia bacterium]|nr:hypothetical protein [Planctomycetia bacterium]